MVFVYLPRLLQKGCGVYKQLARMPRSRCAGQTNFAFIAKSSTEGQHFLVHCYSSPYQNQQMNQCLGVREALRKTKLLGLQVYHPNQQQIGRGCAQTPALCTTRLTIFCLYSPQEILTETYLVAYQYLSLRKALTLDWTKFQSYVTQKEIFFYLNQSNFSLPVTLFFFSLYFFFW